MTLGPVEQLGVSDGQQAVKLVRARAAEFGIDPKRIGIIRFSAGGAFLARNWLLEVGHCNSASRSSSLGNQLRDQNKT